MCLSHWADVKAITQITFILLPRKCAEVKERETGTNSGKLYNFFCRTEGFKRSPLVYAIDIVKCNDRLDVWFLIVIVLNFIVILDVILICMLYNFRIWL